MGAAGSVALTGLIPLRFGTQGSVAPLGLRICARYILQTMPTLTSRREFIRFATFTIAGLSTGLRGISAAADVAEKPLYAVPFLGDLHFDRWAHHDLDWVKKEKPGDVKQMEGYVHTTEQYTPKLFAEVAAKVKALKSGGVSVPFVLQIGDLVEGLCGNFDLQSLQFRDAIAAVEQSAFGVPTLLVKGNHDITGPGATDAFDKVLLPWVSKQADAELKTANYVRRQGDDLFVFFDAYKPDLDWLEKSLSAKQNAAKHVFFVIHPPVVPYNARSDWHIFSREKQRDQRERLLSLLGRYKAIVLSGHLHKYSLLTRKTSENDIVQLAVCSVLRSEKEQPKDVLDKVDRYGPDLVNLEPKHSPDTVEARRQLLKAEAPSIKHFEYADTAGYSLLNVYANRIDVELYCGIGQPTWKTRHLQEPRAQ